MLESTETNWYAMFLEDSSTQSAMAYRPVDALSSADLLTSLPFYMAYFV